MADMYIYNVDVIAHNDMEETLIHNTDSAISTLKGSHFYYVNRNYYNAYARLMVLEEVGIITTDEFEYLSDYILMIWKQLKRFWKLK